MSQNRSSAVMQQRIEADDSLDDFPTPPWATRALMEHALLRFLPDPKMLVALEPCCNRGFMARPLQEYFGRTIATDIFDYGWEGQELVADFLFPGYEPVPGIWRHADAGAIDLVFANPPFRLAEQFIQKSLRLARLGCAMLVRTSFQEGVERYNQLFRDTPPTIVAQFSERVIMHKGVLRDPSKRYWDAEAVDSKTGARGTWKKPSTATSYCWLVWLPRIQRQPTIWIPPCRRALERAGDYPANPDQEGIFDPRKENP